MGDVVESRCSEAFFGEDIFCGVEEQRTSVLEAPFARPPLSHGKSLPQNLRNSLATQILTGIFSDERRPKEAS